MCQEDMEMGLLYHLGNNNPKDITSVYHLWTGNTFLEDNNTLTEIERPLIILTNMKFVKIVNG